MTNKIIFLIYDAAIDGEIEMLLESLQIDGYTRWEFVTGFGGKEKRHGSKVWPGMNSMRIIADSEEKIEALIREVKELRDKFAKPPALKLFKIPVEQIEL